MFRRALLNAQSKHDSISFLLESSISYIFLVGKTVLCALFADPIEATQS